MWLKKWKGPLASSALALGLTVVAGACGSGNSASPGDAGTDSGTHPPTHLDSGFEAAAHVDAGPAFDGTTGKTCATDSDCTQFPGQMNRNQCSNDGMYFGNGAGGAAASPIDPTPICLSPALCNLGTDPNVLQYCDSADPNDPTSPGLCLSFGTVTTGLAGQCYPKCTILSDGSAPIGCAGADKCAVIAAGTDQTGVPIAIGICIGGCTQDADCPTGSVCELVHGVCKVPAELETPTKQLGAACTVNDSRATSFACVCLTNATTSAGFCSSFCVVGSTTATCPAGYVCDAGLPSTIQTSTGASIPGFATQNVGLQGECLPTCTFEAGATDAAQGSCPGAARCIADPAGDVCVP